MRRRKPSMLDLLQRTTLWGGRFSAAMHPQSCKNNSVVALVEQNTRFLQAKRSEWTYAKHHWVFQYFETFHALCFKKTRISIPRARRLLPLLINARKRINETHWKHFCFWAVSMGILIQKTTKSNQDARTFWDSLIQKLRATLCVSTRFYCPPNDKNLQTMLCFCPFLIRPRVSSRRNARFWSLPTTCASSCVFASFVCTAHTGASLTMRLSHNETLAQWDSLTMRLSLMRLSLNETPAMRLSLWESLIKRRSHCERVSLWENLRVSLRESHCERVSLWESLNWRKSHCERVSLWENLIVRESQSPIVRESNAERVSFGESLIVRESHCERISESQNHRVS